MLSPLFLFISSSTNYAQFPMLSAKARDIAAMFHTIVNITRLQYIA